MRAGLAAALVAAVVAAGCGDGAPVEVVAPKPIPRHELARYPAGSPARSTLELLRAVQLNDPVAAGRYLDPALGLSRAAFARSLPGLRQTALALRVPRRLTVTARGSSTALVNARLGRDRVVLRWARDGAAWRLTGIGARSASLARVITNFLFFAHHPERHARPIGADEPALFREWYAVWYRVRAVGK